MPSRSRSEPKTGLDTQVAISGLKVHHPFVTLPSASSRLLGERGSWPQRLSFRPYSVVGMQSPALLAVARHPGSLHKLCSRVHMSSLARPSTLPTRTLASSEFMEFASLIGLGTCVLQLQ